MIMFYSLDLMKNAWSTQFFPGCNVGTVVDAHYSLHLYMWHLLLRKILSIIIFCRSWLLVPTEWEGLGGNIKKKR